MGAGASMASLPPKLDKAAVQALAGDTFDEDAWKEAASYSESGFLVSKKQVEQAAGARPAIESIGVFQGQWWEDTGVEKPCYYSIGIDFTKGWKWLSEDAGGIAIEGELTWKLDNSGSGYEHLANKVGQIATEFVRGEYNWVTGRLDFTGYDMDEAGKTNIALSSYKGRLDLATATVQGSSAALGFHCPGMFDAAKVDALANMTRPEDSGENFQTRVYARVEHVQHQAEMVATYTLVPAMVQALKDTDLLQVAFKERKAVCPNIAMAIWASDEAETRELMLALLPEVLDSSRKLDSLRKDLVWFRENILPLNLWFKKDHDGEYMFRHLLKEGARQYAMAIEAFGFVTDPKLRTEIRSEELVTRQDQVGLAPDAGTKVGNTRQYDMEVYNSLLRVVGSEINQEFGNFMSGLLATVFKPFHGSEVEEIASGEYYFSLGPIKGQDRCRAKVANDYMDEEWPQSAKLLDVVRCAYVFASPADFIVGYQTLASECQKNPKLNLARVKNGFVGDEKGYRDVKLNVVFEAVSGQRMVCEVQLILCDMYVFKKRAHGFYGITRDELFYEEVVKHAETVGISL